MTICTGHDRDRVANAADELAILRHIVEGEQERLVLPIESDAAGIEALVDEATRLAEIDQSGEPLDQQAPDATHLPDLLTNQLGAVAAKDHVPAPLDGDQLENFEMGKTRARFGQCRLHFPADEVGRSGVSHYAAIGLCAVLAACRNQHVPAVVSLVPENPRVAPGLFGPARRPECLVE